MNIDINGLRNQMAEIVNGQNMRVLFKAKPTINQTLNFDVINYMLKKRKNKTGKPAKGLILNLVRAHPYILSLLKKKKLDVNNVIFIDALFNISGDTRKLCEQAVLLPTPFSKTFEEDVFRTLSEAGAIDFILIDDIGALQNYWTFERIQSFLEKLSIVLSGMGDPPVFIIADITKDERIITAAGAICDKIIEVDGIKVMPSPVMT